MMNESRKSNDQKSVCNSYDSDSDDSVVYKFVENLLLSRAKELTNLSTLERKDENKICPVKEVIVLSNDSDSDSDGNFAINKSKAVS